MRIAIASDDGQTIAAHTGRCACLVVFEVADGTVRRLESRPNTFTAHARGQCSGGAEHDEAHAHHSHAPFLDAVADCGALITRGLGPRLVADLTQQRINVLVTSATSVDEAAREFALGRLARVGGTGCCQHGG